LNARRAVKVVYFIALYKQPRQFAWLWRALQNPVDYFIVHIDRNAPPEIHNEVRRIAGERDNVRYLQSIPTAWGGWSLCRIELDAIALALGWRSDWSFFINLSGQDYPARPVDEIRDFLSRHEGTSFVDVRPVNAEPFHIRRRAYTLSLERNGKVRRFPIPVLYPWWPSIEWYGLGWHILAHDFCAWLADAALTPAVCRRLKYARLPCENFMQVLLMSSPFRDRVIRDDKRFGLWSQDRTGHAVLTRNDFDALRRSSALFCRKFDETVDTEVLLRMAELTRSPTPDHAAKG
jgi:hypothetical protein